MSANTNFVIVDPTGDRRNYSLPQITGNYPIISKVVELGPNNQYFITGRWSAISGITDYDYAFITGQTLNTNYFYSQQDTESGSGRVNDAILYNGAIVNVGSYLGSNFLISGNTRYGMYAIRYNCNVPA